MKLFLKYTITLLLSGFTLLVLLDLAYTAAFNKGAHRTKVMWMYDMEGVQVDYLILGSSRANYTLKPVQIEAQTGKKGLNLGLNATNIVETQLMLEEYLENNSTKAVYVQVDFHYDKKVPDPVGEIDWMPFIHKPSVYEQFKPYSQEYKAYRYIPFYRYQKFGGRLGAREAIGSALGSGYEYDETRGYVALHDSIAADEPYYPIQPEWAYNDLYRSFTEFCEARNINVYYFTAPYYNVDGELPPLKEYLANYTDFSDSLKQSYYFSDAMHVNDTGAEEFTNLFIDSYFDGH